MDNTPSMTSICKTLGKMDLIIAIDGHAACGKSTLARALAECLGYRYIDSGAMYRAVTLYFKDRRVDLSNAKEVASALRNIHIDFSREKGKNLTLLNGQNVEEAIRTAEVNEMVSPVAAVSAVREKLVEQQKRMGRDKRIVMDGRDIGTVVFPEADLKLFVTASLEVRTRRRLQELISKNQEADHDQVRDNLQLRDHIDSTRSDSPLIKAADALVLDTSDLTPDLQLEKTLMLLKERFVH